MYNNRFNPLVIPFKRPACGAKYLGMTLTNQNLIYKEIKSRLNSGDACCHSFHNILLSAVRNIKKKIYRTIILCVVLYRCKTLSLTLREACGLRVFENRVLPRIFRLKRDEVIGGRIQLCNK
jgi:hypothetical protein